MNSETLVVAFASMFAVLSFLVLVQDTQLRRHARQIKALQLKFEQLVDATGVVVRTEWEEYR